MEAEQRKRQSSLYPGYIKRFQALSNYLGGVSENSLRSWVKRGMPRIRIGDITLFRLSDVDAWLESFKAGGTFTEEDVSLDDILVEVNK